MPQDLNVKVHLKTRNQKIWQFWACFPTRPSCGHPPPWGLCSSVCHRLSHRLLPAETGCLLLFINNSLFRAYGFLSHPFQTSDVQPQIKTLDGRTLLSFAQSQCTQQGELKVTPVLLQPGKTLREQVPNEKITSLQGTKLPMFLVNYH